MKTYTLVGFLTLGLVSSNTVASVLPHAMPREWLTYTLSSRRYDTFYSVDDPTSMSSPVLHQMDVQDGPEPVPPSTRRSRFRKQGLFNC